MKSFRSTARMTSKSSGSFQPPIVCDLNGFAGRGLVKAPNAWVRVLSRRVEGVSHCGVDGELGEYGPLIGWLSELGESGALAARLICTRIALGISFSASRSRKPAAGINTWEVS